jgi:hypothetical protein
MKELGPATDNDMVLAFLQAEIDSTRFGGYYSQILSNSSLDRSLIDKPDMQSAQDNRVRRQLLKLVRGYEDGTYLFQGFPGGVTWRRIGLTPEEFGP